MREQKFGLFGGPQGLDWETLLWSPTVSTPLLNSCCTPCTIRWSSWKRLYEAYIVHFSTVGPTCTVKDSSHDVGFRFKWVIDELRRTFVLFHPETKLKICTILARCMIIFELTQKWECRCDVMFQHGSLMFCNMLGRLFTKINYVLFI